MWSLLDYREVATFSGHTGDVVSLALSPDSTQLLSASSDRNLKLWSLSEFREIATFQGHKEPLRRVVVTPDGRSVISASDSSIKQWTLVTRFDAPIADHGHMVLCVAVTPDGQYCISGAWDRTLKLWSFRTQRLVATLTGHTAEVNCLAVTGDSKYCVSGSRDKTLRLWDLGTMELVAVLKGHRERVICVAVMPDGKRCVSGSRDSTLKVWSLEERKELATFTGHSERILCVAVTPDGQYCISGSVDKSLKLWSISDLCEIATFKGHTGGIESICVAPNGKYCISGSEDRTLKVWGIEERREIATLTGHVGAIGCIAITSDSNYCLSGAYEDRSLNVWSLSDFRHFFTVVTEHKAGIWCVAVTPDHKYCVSGAKDGTVRLHALSLASWNGVSVEIAPSELIANISYFREGTPRDKSTASASFPSHNFNSLHISAYYNHSSLCSDYLQSDVPLIRGAFGSPLTVSLSQKSAESTDAILRFLIEKVRQSDKKDGVWPAFVPITDDLPDIIASKSDLIIPFLTVLMQSPESKLPQFINPKMTLPATMHLDNRVIPISEFDQGNDNNDNSQKVKFFVSLVRWNLTPGSHDSVKLLTALADCENKSILQSPYASTVITDKWNQCYRLTLGITVLYGVLLVTLGLILVRFWVVSVLVGVFLTVNCCFMAYEVAKITALRDEYWKDGGSLADVSRAVVSAIWGISLFATDETWRYLTLFTVILCFFRGFAHFRSFKSTRVFVYLAVSVFREMYCFIAILVYSIFAFDLCTSVLLSSESWMSAFSLVIGGYDYSQVGLLEWTLFLCASIASLTLLLNLLISILSQAFEKSQITVQENDLHNQLSLILEYELLMSWRRTIGTPKVLAVCQAADQRSDDWSGPTIEVQRTITKEMREMDLKFNQVVSSFHQKWTSMEERLNAMEEKLGRVRGVEEKVEDVQGKLDAILALLKTRA